MAVKNKQNLTPTEKALLEMERDLPNDEEIVDMINEWREDDDEEDVEIYTLIANKPLKRGNIAPDEVVKIIKDYRAKNKIVYAPYQASDNSTEEVGKVRKKLEELEEIFM
ncbi:hypothetical protein C1646_674144 [Rhizophagus diaphanus]|nr:hypothetical protein C1646_674144 [Rhizophagus diaphanus] [Rhizophagus sp. MUCL 43196]